MHRGWQINLSQKIDSASGAPLYMQIAQAIIHDIEAGRIVPGAVLPSSRALAQTLYVSRKTVVTAYDDLIAQGWLSTSTTSGTFVSDTLSPRRRDDADDMALKSYASGPTFPFRPSPSRPIALADGSGVAVDEGSPDDRLFPLDELARSYRSALRSAKLGSGLHYGNPRGLEGLRSGIANMLKAQRGLATGYKNICMTRGSQQAIFLSGLALLKPGHTVIVEELTYEPAVAAFRVLGADVVPVSLDSGGIDVDEVEEICRKKIVKAVFVTPHHQFPTTVSMAPKRRLELTELARQFGFAIIEDDYDHEFHFESQPLLPIAAYAPEHVIYIGSLSKLLVPALRIGYVAANQNFIDALSYLISLNDAMGNALTEAAVQDMLENGQLLRHARKARKIYAARRTHFAYSLEAELGRKVDYQTPNGGLAFWLRFNADVDEIEAKAVERGLRFASNQSYKTRPTASSGLRIGFASRTEQESQMLISTLAHIIDQLEP
ncbi:MAG: PLP-dependent aminotransferase family protein [Pseudomonadota bacterium]